MLDASIITTYISSILSTLKSDAQTLDCIMTSNQTLCMLKSHTNPGVCLRPVISQWSDCRWSCSTNNKKGCKHTWQEVMVVHVHEALSRGYMPNLQAAFWSHKGQLIRLPPAGVAAAPHQRVSYHRLLGLGQAGDRAGVESDPQGVDPCESQPLLRSLQSPAIGLDTFNLRWH